MMILLYFTGNGLRELCLFARLTIKIVVGKTDDCLIMMGMALLGVGLKGK